MIKRLLSLCLFAPATLFAQISDDFEDGNISNWFQSSEVHWEVSNDNPINGNYSLHHIFNNADAGKDQISMQFPIIDLSAENTTWRFKIKYDYNPSDGNNWSVFLVSDADATEMIPGGNINAYAIGVNFTGSDDILKLLKITAGNATEIITTSLNWDDIIDPSSIVALEIKRSTAGDWEVLYNSSGDFNNLESIGTGNDLAFTVAEYFGIYYDYTSSADQLLWIDDVYIGPEIIDNEKPRINNIAIINSQAIDIEYSEIVDSSSAVNATNYVIDDGLGNPDTVTFGETRNVVDVYFNQHLTSGTYYNIDIKNIKDKNENVIKDTTVTFLYYIPNAYDIVINELLADPTPSIELPEYEYIEIYNKTEFQINLKNWKLEVGSSTDVFPEYNIEAGEYLILCDQEAESSFSTFGNVLAFSSFPTLLNTGQTIVLRDNHDHIISFVSYSDDWYQNDYKAEGGWSLEQIDPLNPCDGENNWIASESELGGTPGQINSVNHSNLDITNPELLRVTIIDNHSVQLFFSESLDSISAIALTNYVVDNGVGSPTGIELLGPDYKSLILHFTNEISKGLVYTIEITGNITDCVGNVIPVYSSARFAIPEEPDFNDLVINEVLFNPLLGGVDFVEICNRSNKIIDLKDLYIANYDWNDGSIKNVEQVSTEGFLIFPNEYLVITEDPEIVQQHYYTSNPKGFVRVADLPSYNDDKGRVILMDKVQNTIENFEYDADMHFALLATNEGVSLERINFDRPTNENSNWHSASDLVGFATPAYQNSQYLEIKDTKDEVRIEPEIFSPDNDGFEDVANIIFEFIKPGYVTNIKIFDSRGRLVRYLANNKLLGVDGIISWDGLDDNNQKASVGIYVVFIELFDLDGNVKQYKKSVVVATKW